MENPKRRPKILTSSAEAYARSEVKDLDSYVMEEVDAFYGAVADVSYERMIEEVESMVKVGKKKLADRAQTLGAEVVVDARHTIMGGSGWCDIYYMGTALVPKKR